MKKVWMLLVLTLCMVKLSAEESEKPKIRLQVEMIDSEVSPLGIQQAMTRADLFTKLVQSSVPVGDEAENPLLLFRLKTLEVDHTIVAFVQLAFFENAQLERNKNTVMTMTWSQATLVTASQKDIATSISTTALTMCANFINEYHKVFSLPQPK